MEENVSNSKKRIAYYIAALVLVVVLFVLMFCYVGNKIDKSLEKSSKPLLEEVSKISTGMEEIKGGVSENEEKMNALDETVIFNISEVQILRDSLALLLKEINYLSSKVNSLLEFQKSQKDLNEYWGGKTLEVLNWKLDMEEASRLEEIKKEEQIKKIVVLDTTPVIEIADTSEVVKKRKRLFNKDNNIKIKDQRNY